MADTEHYVREDVRGFLEMLKALGQAPIETAPIEAGREGYRAMGPLVEREPRDLAVIRDLTCPGAAGEIPLRLYDARESRAAGPAIMFFHGGGFVIGDLESHHSLCTEIAAEMDLPVIAVDYRLAPEAPVPAAPDDCEAATRWVAASPEALGRHVTGLITMGDSAGGNLAIVTTNTLASFPADVPVIMQVPIYPVADDVTASESFKHFAEGFLLTAATMVWFADQYAADPTDPRNFPALAEPADSPPTVLCTAGLDPLRDSGRNYAAHLIKQGTNVTYLEFQGNIHGFTNLRKAIPSAQLDLDTLIAAMKAMLAKSAPRQTA